MEQIVCLGGMPRSGSTVLSSILNQNPIIYGEGNSSICQFIVDMHLSSIKAAEQLCATNRKHTCKDIIGQIPKIYYKDIEPSKKIIIDKCRMWPLYIQYAIEYISPNIKMIVLDRPVTDICKSFMKLYTKNNWTDETILSVLNEILEPKCPPITLPIEAVNVAKRYNSTRLDTMPNAFLIIKYDDFINNPKNTIERIYDFCGWEPYQHDFENILNPHPENDTFYKLKGFHDVRPVLKKEENNIGLPPEIFKKCQELDKLLGHI